MYFADQVKKLYNILVDYFSKLAHPNLSDIEFNLRHEIANINLNAKQEYSVNKLYKTIQPLSNSFRAERAYQFMIYLLNQEIEGVDFSHYPYNKRQIFNELRRSLDELGIREHERLPMYRTFALAYKLKKDDGLSPDIYRALQVMSPEYDSEII